MERIGFVGTGAMGTALLSRLKLSGGRALASKALVERLGPREAADLALDLNRLVYTPLANLANATEKARRDAPAIAVCEI